MNILDRAIGWVAPQAALGRVRARMALTALDRSRGGYDGARMDWRGSSWRAEPVGANAALLGDLATLRNRSRSLVRNTPLAKRAVEILVGHLVGEGVLPAFRTRGEPQRLRLKAAWDRYVEEADARRQTTIYGLQEQAARAMIESGEVIALRHVYRHRGAARLSWVMLEADHLDHQRNGIYAQTQPTRLGVTFEKDGFAPAGYYLFPQHPGDTMFAPQPLQSALVDASQVLHLYRIRRPGQVRGAPELAAVLMQMRDLADYLEAALVKARVEACFVGAVTSELDAGQTLAAGQRKETQDGVTRNFAEMVPGSFVRLNPGEKVAFGQPTSNSGLSEFVLNNKLEVASGIGVTYDQATGDLRQANYSSLRAGKIEFRRHVATIQKHTLIPMLCAPMLREFVDFALVRGDLKPSDAAVGCDWIPPAHEPVDPLKDLQADVLAVRTGRMTWAEFVAGWGQDPREQLRQIKDLNDQIDDLGLIFDTDARKVSASGLMQPQPQQDARQDA